MEAPTSSEHPSEASELIDALLNMNRALVSFFAQQAHASKLGLIEYLILGQACQTDGVTARDAARAFDLSTSTMTGISDRLERDKLVRRHPHPTDRRILVLKATRRGQAVVARSTRPLLAGLGELVNRLDPDQLEMLTSGVKQVAETVLPER